MKLLVQAIVSGLTGAAIGAGLLGLFGFLTAGVDGIVNGLIFGGVIGFAFGLGMVGFLGSAFWWRGVIGRYGDWRQRRDTGQDKP